MDKLLVSAAIGFTLALTGCYTWNGFGKDLEKAGDKLQKLSNN